MKKILFAAAAIAAALFASCDKTDDTLDPAMPETSDTARIAITLTGADEADTRAFFDTSAKAEAWESSLSSLSVFAFDNSGALIIRRDFTSSELASKSATFALPKSAAGTECSFYAVANYDASSAKTRAALTALVEKSAADYNGTFAEVSSAAKRSGGFVMSGSTSKNIGAVNSTTSVGITLKRTVAKVALQTTIDPSFADKYAGELTINSVKLSKAASQSSVVAGTPTPGAMSYTHTQTLAAASGKYNALFYCFENGSLTAGNRVLLEINATYDLDGNGSTTDDRSEVTYSVELTGKAAGEILRNGYYRIAANITGLVGQDCAVTVTVADWETPVTQSVELGAESACRTGFRPVFRAEPFFFQSYEKIIIYPVDKSCRDPYGLHRRRQVGMPSSPRRFGSADSMSRPDDGRNPHYGRRGAPRPEPLSL